MSFFSGYSFFVYLFLLLLPAMILGYLEQPLRGYRRFLTAFFIWAVYRGNPGELLYLLIYAVLSVYLVRFYLFLRMRYGRNRYLYGHAVCIALAPLLVCKISGLYGKNWFAFLGISYMVFRVVQVVIEIYDGVIEEINEIEFLEFILFFPCLSSGPIDRSRRFAEDSRRIYNRSEYGNMAAAGIDKLVLGMFYKIGRAHV